MPHGRSSLLVLLAAAVALASPATAGDGPHELATPHRLYVSAPVPAAALGSPRRTIAAVTRGWQTFRTGSFAVTVSPSYADSEEAAVRWGDFVTRLVHGDELAGLQLYLGTGGEVWTMCGIGASGCYAPADDLIVSVGDGSDGIRPEAVVAHEYGHHLAASRDNAPWPALDWGPKRWATALGVCVATRQHRMYPTDEGLHYTLNPGEGFAETYRVLNRQPLSDDGDEWSIVAPLFEPSARLLAAARRDVLDPWRGPTRIVRTGTLGPGGKATVSLSTPLDGTLEYRVHGATVGGSAAGSRTVCGSRRTRLKLAGAPGAHYVLTALRP